MTLDAIPDAVAGEIKEGIGEATDRQGAEDPTAAAFTADGHPPHRPSAPPQPQAADASSDVIYSISKCAYLLISITYGQFALFLPVITGLYAEASKWLPLPGRESVDVYGGALPWWGLALVLVLAVAAAVAYGLGITWLRYRSFQVRAESGGLSITEGLISRESRRVLSSQVNGLKVEQNPFMRALGYGKLSLVSRESGRKVGTNVIFPAVKLDRLALGIDQYFPGNAGLVSFRRQPHTVFLRLVPAVSLALLGATWAVTHALRPGAAVPLAGCLALVLVVAANRGWTSASLDPTRRSIQFRRGFLWVKQYVLPIICSRNDAKPGPSGTSFWSVQCVATHV